MEKKPLSKEELMLSYSKYYFLPIDPPDPAVTQILNNGPLPVEQVMRIEEVDKFFEPGYQPAEYGFCALPDGTAYQAYYHRFDDVTAEMIDWWFCWHFVAPPSVPREQGNLRYKLWNPYEHWDTGAATEEGNKLRCDNSQPIKGRAAGITDFIIESIDGTPMKFFAHTVPVDVLIKPEYQHAPDYGTAIIGVSDSGVLSSVVLQFFRKLPGGGIEQRLRIWYGYTIEDGKVVKKVNPDLTQEDLLNMARGGFKHNMVECPHLGKFLAALYAEEGWKPVDVY